MAERSWTDSQLDAIRAVNGTLLVAAAAGSGKTAVLVQRALERLTDPLHPVDADRLLIVTFTKAAAAEMRARLETALGELVRRRPEDGLLRRQSLLLGQAHIGTVDSFCAEMLREFFYLLDIPPDFRIVTDKQEEELTAAALSDAVTAAFETGSVTDLADAFAGERDDRRLGEMVLALYRFMQSHPFPEDWLRDKVDLYFRGDAGPWERVILDYAAQTARHGEALCASALARAEADPGTVGAAFADALRADQAGFAALGALAEAGDWDGASALAAGFSPARRGRVREEDKDGLYEQLAAVREELKDAMKDLSALLWGTRAGNRAELRAAAPLMESLMELTLDFSRRYGEKKRDRGALDYSDLEHLAIRLFLTPGGERTETALTVARRFEEIMIDEYQDINEVQDSLFRAVSRKGENRFMVGDVKQSIYGFRLADPKIFLRSRRAFRKYDRAEDAYPAYVTLDRNFRSRGEVTDTVNFVFSLLMSQAAGEIDYTGEERLVCAADYPDGPGCETELTLISKPAAVPAAVAEARWIGRRIRQLVEEGFTVTEGGQQRPADYGDFCILLRSANKYAYSYAQALQAMGIPAAAGTGGGFFSAAEIGLVLSLLQVIDNPNQDIPLLSVLMSPLYGFSPDDCAALRLAAGDRRLSLYAALTLAAREKPRCAAVLADLARWRSLAATMTADAFLTLLYEQTGYPDLVLAMENGGQRLRNLRLLQGYAAELEGGGYHGLSGFVRFLDRLRRSDSDLQGADAAGERRSAVTVMSIHKSKGLEFPVCIVAGCGRNFVSDSRAEVLLHPELGLGVKLRDPALGARTTTTAREAIALETARASAAEELRVLYVAMTRAREKLILVGSGEDMARSVRKLGLELSGGGISPYTVRRARNAAQWLILCALCHPDGRALRDLAGREGEIVRHGDYSPWRITLEEYRAEDADARLPEQETDAAPDPALLETLRAAVDAEYPYAASLGIPAKVAASKLAAEQGAERPASLSRPAWLGAARMTPAQRGTALHRAMQFVDFAAARDNPTAELARLAARGYLSPEEAAAVEPGRITAFLESPLGRRVLAAERVEREKRFTAVLPARLAQPDREGLDEGETVILQGAVDCLFIEDGRVNIIDFKTDRVGSMETLWAHYAPQLRLYGAAMQEVLGLPVGELILWSTHLNQASARPYPNP